MSGAQRLGRGARAAVTATGLALALAWLPALAVPLPNVDPTLFADDLDEGGLFDPTSPTFAVELIDVAGEGGPGAEFGFYFAGADVSDPANLVTIFDVADQGAFAEALVDFVAGAVVDTDDGNSIQSIFTPTVGPIGFYLSILGTPIFSEPANNIGGADLMGTFPLLADPSLLVLGFVVPDTTGLVYVAFELLGNVEPVPEPGSLPLLATAFLAMAVWRRRKFRDQGRGLDERHGGAATHA